MALQDNGHDKRLSGMNDKQEGAGSPLPTPSFTVMEVMDGSSIAFATSSIEPAESVSTPSARHITGSHLWPGWPYDKPPTPTSSWTTETRVSYGVNDYPTGDVGPGSTSSVDWEANGPQRHLGTLYAGAVVVPIAVLTIIVALVFFCLRRRKQQNQARTVQMAAQEMTMQPRSSAHPYMAPSLAIPTHLSTPPGHLSPMSPPIVPPPIILGPISSGANGGYLTGMDTSDSVSVMSEDRAANPFADDQIIVEPPPPYQPRSLGPLAASRQSSLRRPAPTTTTLPTHTIERSPFEDPPDNDDAVSELSEVAGDGDNDAMSAVSDLSYQHDPIVNSRNHV